MSILNFTANKYKLALVGIALAFTGAPTILISAEPTVQKKELSDKVQEAIQTLTTLQTEQKWDEALTQVDSLIAKAAPESFDIAYLSQLKVQLYFGKQEYSNAIDPLETSLALSERHGYFGEKDLELLWILAQLYGQEATTDKSLEGQRLKFDKAYSILRKWLDRTPKSNPDAQYFAASILYNQALYDQKIDKELMQKAHAEAEKGMAMSIKPKEQFYALLMAIAQQTGDFNASANYLEILVKEYPKNKSYWQGLLNAYLVQEDKGFLRAINTLERAQKQGQLTEKRDHFTLVALHLNLQQYSIAAELFESGLRNGTLESEQKSWELLATCYQQLHKEDKAIATLKEAVGLFPKAGNLDLQIGNIYYTTDKYTDALKYMQSAISKNLEKPQKLQAYTYIAYLGLELKKLDESKVAAEKAVEIDPNSKGAKDLLKAVNESIKERDEQIKAATAAR